LNLVPDTLSNVVCD